LSNASGLWNGARQTGDGIAKKEKLRQYGNQILVIWRISGKTAQKHGVSSLRRFIIQFLTLI
jgi:hypothetical protein